MKVDEIISELHAMAKKSRPGYKEGMARFGIVSDNALGISLYDLRSYAKRIGKDHKLALKLYKNRIHEAKMLAAFLAEPEKLTEKQMDDWVDDFYSWDICDVCTSTVLDQTPFYKKKIREYMKSEKEFVRRTAFVLIAASAVHDKKRPDREFLPYLPLIRKYSTDERNYVKKAVNWALRQIGKRSLSLHGPALKLAKELKKSKDRSARWIGSDAARELEDPKVRQRLKKKSAQK